MKRLKKVGSSLLKILVIGVIALLLVELVYRYQWIDFYKGEWRYQQKDMQQPPAPSRRVLVLGDSFSATADSWVNQWKQDSLEQEAVVYNAAIPGIGPETFRLLMNNRVKEVQPTDVLLQLYVGNDLYDIRKPVNWSTYSISRNLFWSCSNSLRVLNFMNYRLGQASVEDQSDGKPDLLADFNTELYAQRTRMYIQGNTSYPENVITMKKGMESTSERLVDMVLEMQGMLDPRINFTVLVVPHCCQASQKWVGRYREMGATLSDEVVKDSTWVHRLNAKGIQVIDPLEVLSRAEQSGQQVYFENDPHLNAKGHQLVMEVVRKELKCCGK